MTKLLNFVSDASESTFSAGETLIRQGEVLTDLYILKEGEVEIRRNHAPVCRINSRGSCFGELSALLGVDTIAAVVVTKPSTFAVVRNAASFLSENHAATLEVARLLAYRIRWMTLRDLQHSDDDDEDSLFWRSRV
jgi:CRP-like cAMP-binding protein